MTLTDFLLARIAEDEGAGLFRGYSEELRSRVLAECEARRGIVEAMTAPDLLVTEDARRVAEIARAVVLGHLALPYADHPDYREEWRP